METKIETRTGFDDTFHVHIAISRKRMRELSDVEMEALHTSLKLISTILIPPVEEEEKKDA